MSGWPGCGDHIPTTVEGPVAAFNDLHHLLPLRDGIVCGELHKVSDRIDLDGRKAVSRIGKCGVASVRYRLRAGVILVEARVRARRESDEHLRVLRAG